MAANYILSLESKVVTISTNSMAKMMLCGMKGCAGSVLLVEH